MAMSSLSSKVASVTTRGPVVVFVVITILVIVVMIVFIAYRLWRKDLQTVIVVKSPRKLFGEKASYRFTADRLPATVNGQEFSFSFWLYLSEFTPTSSNKLVFMRGGTENDVIRSNPIVFLDKSTNRLNIAARTNVTTTTSTGSANQDVPENLDDIAARTNRKYLNAVVDYVPLQRWVHYAVVIQDNLMSVYQDGDVYTVENVHDMAYASGGFNRPVFEGLRGDMFVGPVGRDKNVTEDTRGYICNLLFFNYALTSRDVKNIYGFGPVSMNILSRFGIAEYGVRSPIYRVDD
jgi:hypothetical protein